MRVLEKCPALIKLVTKLQRSLEINVTCVKQILGAIIYKSTKTNFQLGKK
jgi:hypothetical protein